MPFFHIFSTMKLPVISIFTTAYEPGISSVSSCLLPPDGHGHAGLGLEELAERVRVLEAAEVGNRLERRSPGEKLLCAFKLHGVYLVKDGMPYGLLEAHLGHAARQIPGGVFRIGFFHELIHLDHAGGDLLSGGDAVAVDQFPGNALQRHDGALRLFEDRHQLAQHGDIVRRAHDRVAVQDGEGFPSGEFFGAEDGAAEAVEDLLVHMSDLDLAGRFHDFGQFPQAVLFRQLCFQRRGGGEDVEERLLAFGNDEQYLFDAAGGGLFHHVLQNGLVHQLRIAPKRPIFEAYIYTGFQEKDNLELADKINDFNSTNGAFFSLNRLNLDHIWEHPHKIRYRHIVKRIVDVTCTSAAIILSSPILLFCALAVKISDPKGPVIFKQTRVGKNGKLFTMYKFRSMYVDAEERKKELMAQNETGGKTFKMKNDPRIYPFGHVLRKFSLDELPQFFNIIKGDMSIVGPRPPIPSEVAEYEPWHRMRLSVTPGLTCIWQVSGRSNISFEGQMRLDNDYIKRNGKLSDDVSLILKTFKVVFKGEGAY